MNLEAEAGPDDEEGQMQIHDEQQTLKRRFHSLKNKNSMVEILEDSVATTTRQTRCLSAAVRIQRMRTRFQNSCF